MATVQIEHTQLIKSTSYLLSIIIVIAVCCCLVLATRAATAVSWSQVFTQTKEHMYFSDLCAWAEICCCLVIGQHCCHDNHAIANHDDNI